MNNRDEVITVLTESGDHVDTITVDHEFEMVLDSYGDVFANYYEVRDASDDDRLTLITQLVATSGY